ncbi:putative ATP-dependent RNA helicase TDRD12 [Agrilus planipennis]|uniref:Probable ATP-dependent RNA helicase spindle-E n=1 Tax=Agrilus planipennis TaxID=224129 RepID=A0A1W4W8M7_AGRPL|nr:putative ATP-dependent RNA helicase TDRD12 [Agrilus planipennis]
MSQTSARFIKLQQKTKLESFASPKILIHGSSIPAPVEKVLSVPFDPEIHKSLDRLGFKEVRQVQMFTWPALRRRAHVFMVSGPKSGKSMAIIPAVASYLQERIERYINLPDNEVGPIAVVLCKGCESAEHIFDLYKKLFECIKGKPSMYMAIPPMDKTRLNQFYKQCDILVATPKTLFWLLHSRIVNLKRLCHFVIEDGDVILQKFSKEMELIFRNVQNMLEHRLCNYSVQMIVASEKWNVHLEKLIKKLNYIPTICINNYLEAALYGRVNFEFVFVKEHHKKMQVVDIIESKMHLHKTIILCNRQSEVKDVLEYLQLKSISAVEINSSNSKEEIYEYEKSWMNPNAQNFVLLCTDEVYRHFLNITDATLLIHYSLPSSWTYFSDRFKVMVDNISSPLSFKQMDENLYCKTYIFMDQSCEMQFPRLVQLLQRLDKTLPSKYMNYYYFKKRKEEAKRIEDKIELCKNIKIFGFCEKVKCPKRHVLSKQLDLNGFLPERGTINFTLLRVEEVNMFYVKLLQFTDTKGQLIKKYSEDYEEMEEKLNKSINLEQDYADDLVVGNYYAVFRDEKLKRCQLLRIVDDATNSIKKTKVIVKLLDYGPQIRVSSPLYNLPKEFLSITPRAFTLYFGNLVPPDGDEKWSTDCKSKLKNALLTVEYNNERSYFSSEVLLLLGHDLWVKNVYLYENIDTLRTTTTKMNVKKVLKDLKLVVEIEQPMDNLYKMCKEADIALPEFMVAEESSSKFFEQVKPNWAFLEGSLNYTEVFLCSVISPDRFFVRLKKFDDLLQLLEKEINAAIQKPFYPDNFVVTKGCSYLAKDKKTEEYRRAFVCEIENKVAKVFLVDYGITAIVPIETLKFLDESFIIKLPYQAIECHLYGVDPFGCSWQNNASKILCDYGFDEASKRTLYTYVYDNTKTGHLTFNLNYGVLLLCYNDKSKPIFINQLLVDCGEAVSSDDKSLDLNVTLPQSVNENEEELEEEPIEEVKNCDNSSLYDDSCSFCSSDIVVFDQDFFLEQFGIKINSATKEETKPAICDNPDKYLPVIKALPPAEYLTPAVNWYQTKERIYLTILLPSVDQFEMKLVREKFLHFWTIHNGREYRLDLIFYSKLKSNFKFSSGLNVKATFVKQEPAEWPRLECTPSHKKIKYDLTKIDFPEEMEKKLFLDLNINDDVECDMNEIIIGSDEDYSESDLEESTSD